MSLAPVVGKFKSVSGLEDIQEEDRSGCFISNGEELDTSGKLLPANALVHEFTTEVGMALLWSCYVLLLSRGDLKSVGPLVLA